MHKYLLLFIIGIFIISCADKNNPVDNTKTPQITSINPTSGYVGSAVLISGKYFGNTQGTSTISFNGISLVGSDYLSWSDSEIKCKVPVGATTGKVIITISNSNTNGIDFTVLNLDSIKDPTLISLTPISGYVGSLVQITGKFLGKAQGTNTISFNGTSLLVSDYQNWSDSVIICKVPSGATTGKVLITINSKNTNGLDFTVLKQDTVKDTKLISLNPTSGYVGSVIQITGKDLGANQGSSSISFNGTSLLSSDYISWSETNINCKVPNGATTGKVVAIINGKSTNSLDFTVLKLDSSSAPKITSITPTIAQVGQLISINGTNFGDSQGTSYVMFNGVKASQCTVWTSTKIVATVPDDATTGQVIVYVNDKPSNGFQFTVQSSNSITPWRTIPAGSFNMGDDNGEMDARPRHKVTFSKAFQMGKSEVTQKQWMTVMDNSNPSHSDNLGDNKPVQQVTFKRAVEFCNRLSAMENLNSCYTINGDNITCNFSANGWRLPTEAEWEYACIAGRSFEYADIEVPDYAWCASNAGGKIHDVMTKKPNAYGLYDMLGNVDEWCWDMYDSEYYKSSPSTDPHGPTNEVNDRIIRGGTYQNGPDKCKSAIRNSFPGGNDNYNFNLGFRVVRVK